MQLIYKSGRHRPLPEIVLGHCFGWILETIGPPLETTERRNTTALSVSEAADEGGLGIHRHTAKLPRKLTRSRYDPRVLRLNRGENV